MINEIKPMLIHWWNNLQASERLYVAVGAIAVVIMLLWSLIWDPIADGVDNLQQNLISKQDDLIWMQKAVGQIKAAGGSSTRTGGRPGQSLLALLEESINSMGLKTALQRMNPDGANQIKFWLNGGSFDQLISLFGELEQKHGITVSNLSISSTDQPGLVDARVTVVRGGS